MIFNIYLYFDFFKFCCNKAKILALEFLVCCSKRNIRFENNKISLAELSILFEKHFIITRIRLICKM